MKKAAKIFIVYFPVILVGFQVLLNLMSFVFPQAYMDSGFYLDLMFGTNFLFAFFLIVLTFGFKFCIISRAAAIAECLFALNYAIVKVDNLYNILFQVIVGTIALAVTFLQYKKKFPLCRFSLLTSFLWSVIKKRSCTKGLEHWDSKIDNILLKRHYENDRP